MDGFEAQPSEAWPDPGAMVEPQDLPLGDIPGVDNRLQETIDFLVSALAGSGEVRLLASQRLSPLVQRVELSEEQSLMIAEALWDERFTPSDGLPSGTSLFDWAFLTFPEPTSGVAAQRFRHKWLVSGRGASESTQDLESVIREVGLALARQRSNGYAFRLSEIERRFLARVVARWADIRLPSQGLSGSAQEMQRFAERFQSSPSGPMLEGLSALLFAIEVELNTSVKVFAKLRHFTEAGNLGYEVVGALSKCLPDMGEELTRWLRIGFSSGILTVVGSAIGGLHLWLRASDEEVVHSPPPDLLREVGLIIASRRVVGLDQALGLARWLFDEGSEGDRRIVGQLCVDGLSYLLEELHYERHDLGMNVPLLRLRCAELASSMAASGFGHIEVVERWIERASTDPLPDIRSVVQG